MSGGDQWYDHGAISSTGDAAVNSSVYWLNRVNWIPLARRTLPMSRLIFSIRWSTGADRSDGPDEPLRLVFYRGRNEL